MQSQHMKSYSSTSMVTSDIPADILSILEQVKVNISHYMRHKPHFELDKETYESKLAPYWVQSHLQVFKRNRDDVYTLVANASDDVDNLVLVLSDKQADKQESIDNPFDYLQKIHQKTSATHTIYNKNHHKYIMVFDLTSECIFSNDEMKTFFHDLFSRNLFECQIAVDLNNYRVFNDVVESRDFAEPYVYDKQTFIHNIMSHIDERTFYRNERAFYRETLYQYLLENLPLWE